MKLGDLGSMYFDSATACYYQDAEGTAPVTEEGQLIGSIRDDNGTLVLVQHSVCNRPTAVISDNGHFVPEFTLE
jgi:hypothetical protein